MSDYDFVLERAKELEHILQNLGASGDGLIQMTKSIAPDLPKKAVDSLRYVGQWRNTLAHDSAIKNVPDRKTFQRHADYALAALRDHPLHNRGEIVNVWNEVQRWPRPDENNLRRLLSPRPRASELIAFWEKASGRKFVYSDDVLEMFRNWYGWLAVSALSVSHWRLWWKASAVPRPHSHVSKPSTAAKALYQQARLLKRSHPHVSRVFLGVQSNGLECIDLHLRLIRIERGRLRWAKRVRYMGVLRLEVQT